VPAASIIERSIRNAHGHVVDVGLMGAVAGRSWNFLTLTGTEVVNRRGVPTSIGTQAADPFAIKGALRRLFTADLAGMGEAMDRADRHIPAQTCFDECLYKGVCEVGAGRPWNFLALTGTKATGRSAKNTGCPSRKSRACFTVL
jgi:hypothetical protein